MDLYVCKLFIYAVYEHITVRNWNEMLILIRIPEVELVNVKKVESE